MFVNFVECLVWWLMWVVFAVCVDGGMELFCLVCACEREICMWTEVYFDGSSVPMKVYIGCSVGCCFVKYVMIVDKGVRVVVGWRGGVMMDGDDCESCVLKGVQFSWAWYGSDCGGCGWKDVGMVAMQ